MFFSDTAIEYLWIIIAVFQIFIFLLGQIIQKPHRAHIECKLGSRFQKKCNLCYFQKQFRDRFEHICYVSEVIFTATTVLICLFYVMQIFSFIAQFLPVSIMYIMTFGAYDPLFKFAFPNWMDDMLLIRY